MRTLYLGNGNKQFKFADTTTEIQLNALDDGIEATLTANAKVRIKNDSGYLLEISPSITNGQAVVTSGQLDKLPAGNYLLELWDTVNGDTAIYPSDGFLALQINENATGLSGGLVSSITVDDFIKQFSDLSQQLKNEVFDAVGNGPKSVGSDPEIVDAKVESSKVGGFTSGHLGSAIRDQINSVLALSGGESVPKTIKRSVQDYSNGTLGSCYTSAYMIPANKTVKRIGFVSSGWISQGDPTTGFLIFMSAGNTVVYRQNLTGIVKGWNEFDVNYRTLEPIFVGICVPGICFNSSQSPIQNYFSISIHEIKPEDTSKVQIGYTPYISSTPDGLYYDFALQLDVVDSLNNAYQTVISPDMDDQREFSKAYPVQKGSLYVSDYVYPSKATVVNIKAYINDPSVQGSKVYVLDATNKVLDIKEAKMPPSPGWTEITFNASYPVDFKLAFYNFATSFFSIVANNLPPTSLYSPFEEKGGLYEGTETAVGSVMPVNKTSEDDYYFLIKTAYIADSDAGETIDRLKYLVTRLVSKTKNIETLSANVETLMKRPQTKRPQTQLKLAENGSPFGFVGRWWTENIGNKDYYMTNNDGSEIYFRTSGSSAITPIWYKKGISTNVYYAYSIDNGPIHRALVGTVITIGDAQEHIVRLTVDGVAEGGGAKWSGNYAIGFGGLSENVTIIGLMPRSPLIHFYGDSITEGIRALGITTTGDMGDTNSVTSSYSYMTAKKLTAAPYIVGYGATGIEATGSFNTLINTISNLYDGKELTTKQEPDLIVVNMGTNDAGTAAQKFSEDYRTAINRLCVMYPGVQIACMVPFNQTHANDIESAIAGISECSLISTEGWATDMEFADGTHPTAKGAEVASDKLAQALINNNLI